MTTIFKSNKIKASQKIGNINRLGLFLFQFGISRWTDDYSWICNDYNNYEDLHHNLKTWFGGGDLVLIATGWSIEINRGKEVGNIFEYKNRNFGELFEFLVSNGMDSKKPKKTVCKLNGFNFRKDVRPKAKPEKIKRKKVDKKIWPVIERAAKLEVNNLESYLKTKERFVMSKLDKPVIRKILRGVIQVIHRDEDTTDVLFENYSFRQKLVQGKTINEVSFCFISQKMTRMFGKKYEYWREASIAIL